MPDDWVKDANGRWVPSQAPAGGKAGVDDWVQNEQGQWVPGAAPATTPAPSSELPWYKRPITALGEAIYEPIADAIKGDGTNTTRNWLSEAVGKTSRYLPYAALSNPLTAGFAGAELSLRPRGEDVDLLDVPLLRPAEMLWRAIGEKSRPGAQDLTLRKVWEAPLPHGRYEEEEAVGAENYEYPTLHGIWGARWGQGAAVAGWVGEIALSLDVLGSSAFSHLATITPRLVRGVAPRIAKMATRGLQKIGITIAPEAERAAAQAIASRGAVGAVADHAGNIVTPARPALEGLANHGPEARAFLEDTAKYAGYATTKDVGGRGVAAGAAEALDYWRPILRAELEPVMRDTPDAIEPFIEAILGATQHELKEGWRAGVPLGRSMRLTLDEAPLTPLTRVQAQNLLMADVAVSEAVKQQARSIAGPTFRTKYTELAENWRKGTLSGLDDQRLALDDVVAEAVAAREEIAAKLTAAEDNVSALQFDETRAGYNRASELRMPEVLQPEAGPRIAPRFAEPVTPAYPASPYNAHVERLKSFDGLTPHSDPAELRAAYNALDESWGELRPVVAGELGKAKRALGKAQVSKNRTRVLMAREKIRGLNQISRRPAVRTGLTVAQEARASRAAYEPSAFGRVGLTAAEVELQTGLTARKQYERSAGTVYGWLLLDDKNSVGKFRTWKRVVEDPSLSEAERLVKIRKLNLTDESIEGAEEYGAAIWRELDPDQMKRGESDVYAGQQALGADQIEVAESYAKRIETDAVAEEQFLARGQEIAEKQQALNSIQQLEEGKEQYGDDIAAFYNEKFVDDEAAILAEETARMQGRLRIEPGTDQSLIDIPESATKGSESAKYVAGGELSPDQRDLFETIELAQEQGAAARLAAKDARIAEEQAKAAALFDDMMGEHFARGGFETEEEGAAAIAQLLNDAEAVEEALRNPPRAKAVAKTPEQRYHEGFGLKQYQVGKATDWLIGEERAAAEKIAADATRAGREAAEAEARDLQGIVDAAVEAGTPTEPMVSAAQTREQLGAASRSVAQVSADARASFMATAEGIDAVKAAKMELRMADGTLRRLQKEGARLDRYKYWTENFEMAQAVADKIAAEKIAAAMPEATATVDARKGRVAQIAHKIKEWAGEGANVFASIREPARFARASNIARSDGMITEWRRIFSLLSKEEREIAGSVIGMRPHYTREAIAAMPAGTSMGESAETVLRNVLSDLTQRDPMMFSDEVARYIDDAGEIMVDALKNSRGGDGATRRAGLVIEAADEASVYYGKLFAGEDKLPNFKEMFDVISEITGADPVGNMGASYLTRVSAGSLEAEEIYALSHGTMHSPGGRLTESTRGFMSRAESAMGQAHDASSQDRLLRRALGMGDDTWQNLDVAEAGEVYIKRWHRLADRVSMQEIIESNFASVGDVLTEGGLTPGAIRQQLAAGATVEELLPDIAKQWEANWRPFQWPTGERVATLDDWLDVALDAIDEGPGQDARMLHGLEQHLVPGDVADYFVADVEKLKMQGGLDAFLSWHRRNLRPMQVLVLWTTRFMTAQASEAIFRLSLLQSSLMPTTISGKRVWPALEGMKAVLSTNSQILAESFGRSDAKTALQKVTKAWNATVGDVLVRAAQGKDPEFQAMIAREFADYVEGSVAASARKEAESWSRRVAQRAFGESAGGAIAELVDLGTGVIFGIDTHHKAGMYAALRADGNSPQTARHLMSQISVEYGPEFAAPIDRILSQLMWFYRYKRHSAEQLAALVQRKPAVPLVMFHAARNIDASQMTDAEQIIAQGRPTWLRAGLERRAISYDVLDGFAKAFNNPALKALRPTDTIAKVEQGGSLCFARVRIPGWEEPGQVLQMLSPRHMFEEIVQAAPPPVEFLKRLATGDFRYAAEALPLVGTPLRIASKLSWGDVIPGMEPGEAAGRVRLPAEYAQDIRAKAVGLDEGASAKDRLMAKVHLELGLTGREAEGYKYILEKTKQLRAQHKLWQWGITVTIIPYNVCINSLTPEQLEELQKSENLPPGVTPKRIHDELKERKKGRGLKTKMEQIAR